MFCIDGNNSLKRIARIGTRQQGDTRIFNESDYYLADEFVDRFAGEVRGRQPTDGDLRSTTDAVDMNDNAFEDREATEHDPQQTEEGDPTDGAPSASPCTKNWKAAASDSTKRMWAIFDESGLFASACRHGLILWIIDMVRSGEL